MHRQRHRRPPRTGLDNVLYRKHLLEFSRAVHIMSQTHSLACFQRQVCACQWSCELEDVASAHCISTSNCRRRVETAAACDFCPKFCINCHSLLTHGTAGAKKGVEHIHEDISSDSQFVLQLHSEVGENATIHAANNPAGTKCANEEQRGPVFANPSSMPRVCRTTMEAAT